MKILIVILILVTAVIWTMVGVANWAFPTGEAYRTGDIIDTYDGRDFIEDWERTPSPSSNPDWVRFFQDNSNALLILSLIGSTFSIVFILVKSGKPDSKT